MTTLPVLSNLSDRAEWIWQGHRIRYAVEGDGAPVFLIHGFGASIGHWRKNITVLAAAGYKVFALDLLGFGSSDKPGVDYNLNLWVELVQDFWTEKINEPTVFVGNSIGGLICLMILSNHPEMGAGGVLLNCAGGLNLRPEEMNLPLRLIMGTFSRLVSSNLVGPFLFDQVRRKRRIRGSLSQVYGNQSAITDELVDLLYRPSCDPGAQKVFASILTAPPGPKPAELLPNIRVPLLVLWGENDPWAPLSSADIYRALSEDATATPPTSFITIPQTGHCPHDERPELVNPIIADWLQRST